MEKLIFYPDIYSRYDHFQLVKGNMCKKLQTRKLLLECSVLDMLSLMK